MRPPLDGCTALITGASSGLGVEFARQIAGRARVMILVARRADRLEKLAAELRSQRLTVHVLPCDLGDHAALEALVMKLNDFGDIDILINNAGLGDFAVYDRQPWARVEMTLDVNVRALARLTHRLLPPMMARRRGGILNVGSLFGLEFLPGYAAYIGSKHFVTGFTEALRLDAAVAGVVVSQLCPGPVATEFQEAGGEFRGLGSLPKLAEISAERCVRAALRAFGRGRALIVPGVLMKVARFLGAITPRWLLRLIYKPLARRIRQALELPASPR